MQPPLIKNPFPEAVARLRGACVGAFPNPGNIKFYL